MIHYSRLIQQLTLNVKPLDAFRSYMGHELFDHCHFTENRSHATLFEGHGTKLEAQLWKPDYPHQQYPFYSQSHLHQKIFYGSTCISVLYPHHKHYVHHSLNPLQHNYLHIRPERNWIMTPLERNVVTLQLSLPIHPYSSTPWTKPERKER